MHGKVKRLRVRGKRLTDREISQQEPVDGELSMVGHQWSMERVLTVRPHNDNASAPLLVLYDVRLMGMHNDMMAFKGEERPQGDDGPAWVQEWSVRIEPR